MRMVAIFVLYFSVFSASNSPRWDRNPHSTSTAGHLALAIMLISGDTEAATRRLLGQSSPLSAYCQAAAAFAARGSALWKTCGPQALWLRKLFW